MDRDIAFIARMTALMLRAVPALDAEQSRRDVADALKAIVVQHAGSSEMGPLCVLLLQVVGVVENGAELDTCFLLDKYIEADTERMLRDIAEAN